MLPSTMTALTFQGKQSIELKQVICHYILQAFLSSRGSRTKRLDVNIVQVPTPRLVHDTDVIIRVSLCSICGSDLHPYHEREIGIARDTIVGHEFVGTVVQRGAQVS